MIDCADAAVLSQGGEFISSCLAKDNALRVSFVVKGCRGGGMLRWFRLQKIKERQILSKEVDAPSCTPLPPPPVQPWFW